MKGGIYGYSSNVNNCYNIGTLSAESSNPNLIYLGEIGGSLGTVSNSYWNIDNTQIINNVPLVNENKRGMGGNITDTTTSLTTAQMKQKASFASFDFDTIWEIDENVSYPYFNLRTSILGDVNGDGNVTIADAMLVFNYVAGRTQLDAAQLLVADVDKSGGVTIADAMKIFQYVAGRINEF